MKLWNKEVVVKMKGSVLVFSLIVLSFMLVTAISVATVAVTERRASLNSSTSNRSFQVADTGVEMALKQIYKGNHPTLASLASALGTTCSGGEVATDGYAISFYDASSVKLTDCTDLTWRTQVAKIKSEGIAGDTTRAVEVAVAATGDYQMNCAVQNTTAVTCCRLDTSSGSLGCKYTTTAGLGATWITMGGGNAW